MRVPIRFSLPVQAKDVNCDPICVNDLQQADAVDRFVQRLDTEVGLECVRDASEQQSAGGPIHDATR